MTTEPQRIPMSDDEPDLCRATQLFFDGVGFETRTTTDALETLALAQSWEPHLIITDLYKVDQMDGVEMIEQLKADDRTRGIPVIVVSAGGANPQRREQALAAGACLVIAKPFDPQELLQTAKEARARAPRPRAGALDARATPAQVTARMATTESSASG